MKCLLIISLPIPIVLWTVVGIVGSAIMGIGYAFVWPVMETFKAISKPGFGNKLLGIFTDSTWSNVWGACTIVRDFADFSFHSYFSVMDELLEAKDSEKPLELKVTQIPGCILAAVLGILADVPMISLIVVYKAPILLFKGWKQLSEDLVGRSGPFLETVCVPIAGLLILLWPFAVFPAIWLHIRKTLQRKVYSMLLLVCPCLMSAPMIFSTFEKGPVFQARPKYREGADDNSPLLPLKGLHEQIEAVHANHSLARTPSERIKALKAVVIWDNFFEACEGVGKELLRDGAIGIIDLEAWQSSKSKIVNIGIPAYAFLGCFLQSIKSGSTGFLMQS